MALNSLKEIKRLRKKYHLTQKDLAKMAGVSQSLITKIESEKLDPSFSKAQLIFEILEQLREKEEIKAKDVLHKKVSFAGIDDSLSNIIKIIKSKKISQLPVISKGNICGLITESIILKNVADNPEKFNLLKAGDIMEDAPPIVSLKTGLKTLLNLLQEYSIVLVAEKGEIKGIISKTDLLENVE